MTSKNHIPWHALASLYAAKHSHMFHPVDHNIQSFQRSILADYCSWLTHCGITNNGAALEDIANADVGHRNPVDEGINKDENM